jgi:hypothetical protein
MGFPPGVVFSLATLLHQTRRSSCSAAFSHVSVNQGVQVFGADKGRSVFDISDPEHLNT